MEMVPIYKDPEYSVEERVEDLMSRMTTQEKVCQLSCAYAYGGAVVNMEAELKDGIGQIGMSSGTVTLEENAELVNTAQEYLLKHTRLGIPAIFHVETLNGGSLTEATTYPVPVGLAASWNPEEVEKMAGQIRDEMTASGQSMAFAPVLDVARDPRWGRMGETYGESPTLISAMGTAYVRGIQGENLEKGMAACAKHFLGYAASEGGMNMSGAHIGARELREIYAKPFAAAIQDAGLKGVMNCYLAIDGEPVTGSKKYLTGLLRDELGFDGVVVSDYGSIDKLCDVFGIAEDKARAGELALRAGVDTETPRRLCLNDTFVERLENGEIPMEIVDTALRRTLRLKFELGLFEDPYADVEKMKAVYSDAGHKKTAYQLACESMTLLKNDGQILPLKEKKTIAVIGPGAGNYRALFGGYTYPAFYEGMRAMLSGLSKSMGLQGVDAQDAQRAYLEARLAQMPEVEQLIKEHYPGVKTVYEAIRDTVAEDFCDVEVRYAEGCGYLDPDRSGFEEACRLAKSSDVVLFVCGGRNGSGAGCTMGENVDTSQIGLPGVQEKLADALFQTETPVVIVHMDGKPLSGVQVNTQAAAVLEAWHPGQMGAQAIADTLFGKNNPCGKLPVTAVRHAGQIPVYVEQHRGSGVSGRGLGNNSITQGYVEEPGFPLYPFGFGLSYTTFAITDCRMSDREISSGGRTTVTCRVSNTGKTDGAAIVQLYFTDKQALVTRPQKELAGFLRIPLKAGESKEAEFVFCADQSAYMDSDGNWRVESGEVELLLGDSSEELQSAGTVRIRDTKISEKGRRTYFSSADVK